MGSMEGTGSSSGRLRTSSTRSLSPTRRTGPSRRISIPSSRSRATRTPTRSFSSATPKSGPGTAAGDARGRSLLSRDASGAAERVRESRERADLEVGTSIRVTRLPVAVDPGDRNAESAAGDDVVEVAPRRVEPSAFPDPPPRGLEVAGSGLVGADLLRGDEELEGDGEVAEGAGEQIVIHVGEDSEAAAGGDEPFERGIGVGKRLPGRERVGQPARALGRQRPAEMFRDTEGCFRQDIPVGPEGFRFDGRLDLRVGGEDLGPRERETLPGGGPFEPRADAALPVDERSVAIESNEVKRTSHS